MLKAVIATKHKKAPLIAPALKPLGYNVVTTSLFDTDTLGMFTNEVQRDCSAQTAALIKAQQACELTGEQCGLGSWKLSIRPAPLPVRTTAARTPSDFVSFGDRVATSQEQG